MAGTRFDGQTDTHFPFWCARHIIYWPFNLSWQFVKINNIKQKFRQKCFGNSSAWGRHRHT